ncbi:hypothetical protein HII31_07327 [Pseudocercospora fuligena]|uniref:Uncharacterized protein n=1 Tax=Pseudocercospora fuligena TaxID=685502 RepID=A0A8H6RGV7_9PEZI|nr:hypothetical protein HII31_07327 [Pseudocercospora fuligena]
MVRRLRDAVITGLWTAVVSGFPESASASGPFPRQVASSTFPSSSTISTAPSTVGTPSDGLVTGSGSAFASSCQEALWEWKSASESYGSQRETLTTYTSSYGTSYNYTYTNYTGGVSATRSTTLCDGYPRVIGSGSYLKSSATTYIPSDFVTNTSVPGPYATPLPCSIGASDCANLWSSFNAFTSASLVDINGSRPEPPCATTGTSYSFAEASCGNSATPANNGIFASTVRLLYWPVRTVSNASSPFCLGDIPQTMTGTRTGEGPNTFVTGSLTITSPMVALSYSALRRGDGCGTTIDHSILTLKPDQLSSVRGARAAYDWRAFNYADLNWMCEGANGTFEVQDTEIDPDKCYQDVQAVAYWDTNPQHDWRPISDKAAGTILNNYKPYVVPDDKLFTEFLEKYWGPTAMWWIDGAWDPPIAMTQVASAAQPTLPYVPAHTTSASAMSPSITPATPADLSTASYPTALPDQESSASAPESFPPSQRPAQSSPEQSSVNIGGIIASALGATSQAASSGSKLTSAIGPPNHSEPRIVVINGQSTQLAASLTTPDGDGQTGAQSTSLPQDSPAPVMSFDDTGNLVVGAQTIEHGSALTLSGTTYSLPAEQVQSTSETDASSSSRVQTTNAVDPMSSQGDVASQSTSIFSDTSSGVAVQTAASGAHHRTGDQFLLVGSTFCVLIALIWIPN